MITRDIPADCLADAAKMTTPPGPHPACQSQWAPSPDRLSGVAGGRSRWPIRACVASRPGGPMRDLPHLQQASAAMLLQASWHQTCGDGDGGGRVVVWRQQRPGFSAGARG